uniref:(northern house mosquito) hypothetical protein n=1 Tax=Culex pipiens TaxID=7175 RepID=A0A8D8FVZ7_CULPI
MHESVSLPLCVCVAKSSKRIVSLNQNKKTSSCVVPLPRTNIPTLLPTLNVCLHPRQVSKSHPNRTKKKEENPKLSAPPQNVTHQVKCQHRTSPSRRDAAVFCAVCIPST